MLQTLIFSPSGDLTHWGDPLFERGLEAANIASMPCYFAGLNTMPFTLDFVEDSFIFIDDFFCLFCTLRISCGLGLYQSFFLGFPIFVITCRVKISWGFSCISSWILPRI